MSAQDIFDIILSYAQGEKIKAKVDCLFKAGVSIGNRIRFYNSEFAFGIVANKKISFGKGMDVGGVLIRLDEELTPIAATKKPFNAYFKERKVGHELF